jgi:hypothetical protein
MKTQLAAVVLVVAALGFLAPTALPAQGPPEQAPCYTCTTDADSTVSCVNTGGAGHTDCKVSCDSKGCGCGPNGSGSCGGDLAVNRVDGSGTLIALVNFRAAKPNVTSVLPSRSPPGSLSSLTATEYARSADCQRRIVGRQYTASQIAVIRHTSARVVI